MRCRVQSYRKLAVGLLAATVVVGLTARAILAQSSPPGPAANTEDEPIKRTVLFRGDLEGAPGKEIVVFVADLAPGAVGSRERSAAARSERAPALPQAQLRAPDRE